MSDRGRGWSGLGLVTGGQILVCVMLLLMAGPSAFGHGRNSTAVSADVSPVGAVVTIDAVVIDLLQIGETGLREWRYLEEPEREARLRQAAFIMAGRFHMYQGERLLKQTAEPRVEVPDFGLATVRRVGIDQQTVRIQLSYAFEAAPAELTFRQNFDGGRSASPIPVQLTIRRQGEMVMLPAELGPFLPVRFPFDWLEEPAPLAHRSSLRSAVCGWENRPATGRLEIFPDRVIWTVYVPFEALPPGLEPVLEISINGEPRQPDTSMVRYYPMSGQSVLQDQQQLPQQRKGSLVEMEILVSCAHPPDRVTAAWAGFSDDCPVVFGEVLQNDRSVLFSVLTPESPVLSWP